MKNLILSLAFISIFCFANSQSIQKKDSLPNMLIITAHPDDWEFTMGGTAYLLKDKYHIHIVIASKGERGLSKEPSTETAAIRVKEAEASAQKINAALHFLGKIDGEIYADKDGVDKVISLLNELKPTLIFILWPIDKPDHAAAANIALMALMKTDMIYDKEIYFTDAGHGATTNQFEPKLYVNTTSVWKNKEELIRCHACQNKEGHLLEGAKIIDKNYGYMIRTEYAEGFVPVYPLSNGRWDSNKKIKCTLIEL
jgi:LmbE family N-acetylglucosaminyl deacetylase